MRQQIAVNHLLPFLFYNPQILVDQGVVLINYTAKR